MATKIILKKNSTAGDQPTTLDLDVGEVAINLADRKLYTKTASDAIIRIDGAYISGTAPTNPVEGDLWYDTSANQLKVHNGTGWDTAGGDLSDFGVTASAAELNILDGATITVVELNHLDGVTSNVQTQLDGKANASHNHTLSDISDAGTAAALNVAPSGNATAGQVVKGDDTRLTDSRDPTAHTHTASEITDFDTEVANNSAVAANTAKVSNATHTGEVTGSTALTITDNAVTAAKLAVTGNGNTTQWLRSDGDGTFTWATPPNTTYSAGTGVDLTGGVFSIGQAVGTTDDVTFNSINVGDLTVTGTLNAVSSNEVNIGDSIIVLNADLTGAPSENAGIEVERGNQTNVTFYWNETDDAWDMDGQALQNVVIDGGSF